MEHIERAGVHSGDSMAIYPGLNLTEEEVDTIVDYTTRIGVALGIRGLMNVQFVSLGGAPYRSPRFPREEAGGTSVYVLEVNPRGSRTVPFISKVTGVPAVNLATRVMLGRSLRELGYWGGLWKRQKIVGIKAPVFSMSKLAGVDWYMGPEMKSTGEVMGLDTHFAGALTKALAAAGLSLKPGSAVLVSIADKDKAGSVALVRELAQAGFDLYATEGTAAGQLRHPKGGRGAPHSPTSFFALDRCFRISLGVQSALEPVAFAQAREASMEIILAWGRRFLRTLPGAFSGRTRRPSRHSGR